MFNKIAADYNPFFEFWRIFGFTPRSEKVTIRGNPNDVPMKLLCSLSVILALAGAARADIIAQWAFDSNPPDAATATGTNRPSVGLGTATLVGGTSATFASGSHFVTGSDDSAWNLAIIPAQGTSNKLWAVQFNVSTEGFEDINVTWDQQNSGNSTKYTRFQYSLDGSNFVDGPVIDATVVGSFVPQSVSLSGITGVNENPNFAIRLAAEFESTAVGGADVYRPSTATATYGASGRIRIDLMTISGNPPSGNQPPTISPISNRVTRANVPIDDIPFLVGDAETAAEDLLITGTSSNPALVRPDGIAFGGSGSNQTVSIFPDFDAVGTTTITLTVTDEGAKSNSTSFVVTVLPDNTAPRISSFTNYHALKNTSLGLITLAVSDLESDPDSLIIDLYSSNAGLIPAGNVALDGTGTNRTLTITPLADKHGTTVVTVTASDGQLVTSNYFNVMILPSASVAFDEPFDYPDGASTTNSGGLWTTHSGTIQQSQILGGELTILASRTEDINARLVGAPFAPASGTKLYASLRVTYSAAPGNPGEYFMHFRDVGGNFRARVYGSTTNASAGTFRFGLANNSSAVGNIVFHPSEFRLNQEQLIVVMYDVAQSASTLWVNPSSETDPSISATDNPNATSIGSIAFRQNTGLGTLAVDDLLIGFSFDDAVPTVRLTIARNGNQVDISWASSATAEGYTLESSPSLTAPDWQPVAQVVMSTNGRDTVTLTTPDQAAFYRLSK